MVISNCALKGLTSVIISDFRARFHKQSDSLSVVIDSCAFKSTTGIDIEAGFDEEIDSVRVAIPSGVLKSQTGMVRVDLGIFMEYLL